MQLESARKKMEANDLVGAKADLSKMIEAAPHNKQALNLRGLTKLRSNDFYGAIGDFNFALESDSTFSEALNNRGEAKMALGDDKVQS